MLLSLAYFREFTLRGAAILAVALLAPLAAAQPLEKVTLQLKWKHQFQFSGYYAAIEKGYYRDAGLEVLLVEAQSGKDYTEPVLNGTAEFGVASSELAVLRAKGKPVVALAPIYQHSPLVLIASEEAGIDNIHDLAGKSVMLAPEEAELFAYLKAEGLDPKSIKLVPHQYDPKFLIDGTVQAISGYSTDEPFDLSKAGYKFSLFRPRSGGIDFYGDTLFTTEKQIADHPERVQRFLAASLRGWQYALDHPGEIISLIRAKYSVGHDVEHLKFEAEESLRLIQPELVEIGYNNPGRWKDIAGTYAELGLLSPGWTIDGLIYKPHSAPAYTWLLSAFALSLGAIGVLAVLALYLIRLNVTVRRQARDLQLALEEVKTIQGILPICGYCKKIRDDDGAWTQIEHYIAEHSDAEFSHGICHDCYQKVRGELEDSRKRKSDADRTPQYPA